MARLNYFISAFNFSNGVGGPNAITFRTISGNGTAPQVRVYPVGDAPSVWFNAPTTTNVLFSGLAADQYQVDYQDSNGIKPLAKINIGAYADSCYPEQNAVVQQVNVRDSFVAVVESAVPGVTHSGSIDEGATYKTLVSVPVSDNAQWTNSEMVALGVGLAIDAIFFRRDDGSPCSKTFAEDVFVDGVELEPLVVGYQKTNCTSIGADDGTITLLISGGSGLFSFLWSDTPTIQNRANLAPGFYSVVVTDLVTEEEVTIENIQILDPQPPVTVGTLLEVPLLNSLTFVVDPVDEPDNVETFQTLDNRLFCKQIFPGFKGGLDYYYNPVCKNDAPVVQFNSNYASHTLEMLSVNTGLVIKNFGSVLREENIGKTSDYNITIRNHIDHPGQSRAYFNVGAPPIPVVVGDTFDILNNAEGFNGTYAIIELLTDTILGYQYIVINKNYDAVGQTTPGTGRFYTTAVNFNVYESLLEFPEVDSGKYYFRLTAFDSDSNFKRAYSEPVDIQVNHPDTNLIKYRSEENDMDMTWAYGYVGEVRIPSTLFKRYPGGERFVSRNSDYSLVKTSAKKTRVVELEVRMVAPYVHEKLSCIFDTDFWTINGVQYQASEGYGEPEYIDRFKLSNATIKIEQVGWFKHYNNANISSIDSGLVTTQLGFVKR